MADHNDDAVKKVLAALKVAAPPEGMDTRIAERLRQQAQAPAPNSRWRTLFLGSTPAAAWGRGALTGAIMATLAIAAVLLAQRAPRTTPKPDQASAPHPATAPITATPVSLASAKPCPGRTAARVPTGAPSIPAASERAMDILRAESHAQSHPAPALPLTPQERQLSRLAHTANPAELAMLTPENQARLQAEDSAAFNKFFTPPPVPKIDQPIPSPDNPIDTEPAENSTGTKGPQ